MNEVKHNRGRPLSMPEPAIVTFAFLLNFVWEFLQIPFYQNMPQATHWDGVILCSKAAFGDVIIVLIGFWLAAISARTRQWFFDRACGPFAIYVLTGVVITLAIEHVAIRSDWGWRYAATMPLIPVIGAGLTPVLQWLVLPPLTLWFARRHLAGAAHLARSGENHHD